VSDPSRDEERELVERAKRDPRQFGALYDRALSADLQVIYSRVREQTAAEDVTRSLHEGFGKAMPRYQDTGDLCCLALPDRGQRYRDRYRDPASRPSLETFTTCQSPAPRWKTWLPTRRGAPDLGPVGSLPHKQRTAVVLKFQEDMKIEDIAVAMGKSRRGVKLLIHRA